MTPRMAEMQVVRKGRKERKEGQEFSVRFSFASFAFFAD
jgi:hypothetical protein